MCVFYSIIACRTDPVNKQRTPCVRRISSPGVFSRTRRAGSIASLGTAGRFRGTAFGTGENSLEKSGNNTPEKNLEKGLIFRQE
ncbi:MAG: hypothetical protein IKD72_07690, partial [Clostridia bacterium]|nr:hypothetical protein [Clostridia bacterium]